MTEFGSNPVSVRQNVPNQIKMQHGSSKFRAASALTGLLSISLLLISGITGCSTSMGSSAAVPTFTPAAGTYTSAQTVTVGDTTPGAVLYCTTDGSTPTTSSPVCSEPTTVAKTETLSAIAAEPGGSPSAAATAAYVINLPAAATPVISPVAGTYIAAQSVTITEATTGATIYYTTDGTAPTAASAVYSGPITVPATETISAIAIAVGYADSNIATAAFTINLPAPAPVITPAGGTFTGAQSVTITDSVTGAQIYYTLDGSTPTQTSTSYSGAIAVNASETVNAVAIAPGYSLSAVATATFNLIAATPTISPAGGSFTTVQSVTIADTTTGVSIYYTVTPGGSAPVPPSTSSSLYTGAIQVAASETIEAIAVANGYTQSAATSAAFTVSLPPATTPVISSPGGTFNAAQTVTITDATTGAAIYYTTNGTTPSASNGTLYIGPISVTSSETIQAVAVAFGDSNSAVASSTFSLVAATPVISSTGGTFNGPQTISITDATAGAAIYYTTDGSTPSATNGTLYSAPISVASSEVLQAIAVVSGFSNSAISSASFTFVAATPKISPAGGTYTTAQSVVISDTTAGVSIYYTVNGSTPSASNGTLYSGPVSLSSSEVIQAIAVESGYTSSAVASASFTINLPAAATPVISPGAGTFTPQTQPSVTITDTTTGANIYYTLDGSVPSTTNGIAYTAPFTVTATETVKAIAVASGYSNSAVASTTYTINQAAAAAPTFSPAGGTYSSAQTVSLGDMTAHAMIYYTTDGSAPSAQHGTLYSAPISVSATETIEAIATATGYNNSTVSSATYTINLSPAATPTFSPAGGTYSATQTVSLSDTSANAAIYYTTDGSAPSAQHGAQYTAAITVSTTETIKAIAIASGFSPSAVASATYTITAPSAGTLTFSPASGAVLNASSPAVTIAGAASGATVYYTIDGTTPSATNGMMYTSAGITVSAPETIKAIAIETGYTSSAVASATYSFQAATPVISPNGGIFTTASESVTISDSTSGATIYYTVGTTGTAPTTSSQTIASGSSISISASDVVEAIAVKTGYTDSSVASASFTKSTSTGPAVAGTVISGAKPIIGASVQLYAAGKTGYGSAPTAVGSAVTTSANGSFLLPFTTCPAAPGDLMYVVATGGSISASGASNAGLALMTALGPCASIPTTAIAVNEVTTIASAYALSGFAGFATGGGIDVGAPAPSTTCSASNVGNSGCNYPGLVNAFATVNNLVDIGAGTARTITPAYAANPLPYLNTSTVPQARIDTLADILATCVQASSGCSTLFSNVSNVGGTAPADTIQAALGIALNPGTNVSALYGLLQTTPPYKPTLASIGDTAAPGDLTLAISYTGGGLGVDPNNDFNDNIANYAIALDGSSNVWVTGAAVNSENTGLVAGFNNQGAPLTPATQYDAVNMFVTQFGGFGPGVSPFGGGVSQLVIDPSNNLWVTANSFSGGNGNEFAEVSVKPVSGAAPNLSVVQLTSAYMGGVAIGANETSFAFDTSVNLWLSTTATSLNEYSSSTGAVLNQYSPSENSLQSLIFDSNGSLWGSGTGDTILFNNSNGNEIANYTNTSGASLAAGASGNIYTCNANSTGYLMFNSSKTTEPVATYNAAGGCNPLVVDGAGNIWSLAGTNTGNYLTEVSQSGTLVTPASGYSGTSSAEAPTTYDAMFLAIDGSGNLWALNQNNSGQGGSVTGNVLIQFVGVAAPTIPNLSVATQNGYQGTKP